MLSSSALCHGFPTLSVEIRVLYLSGPSGPFSPTALGPSERWGEPGSAKGGQSLGNRTLESDKAWKTMETLTVALFSLLGLR